MTQRICPKLYTQYIYCSHEEHSTYGLKWRWAKDLEKNCLGKNDEMMGNKKTKVMRGCKSEAVSGIDPNNCLEEGATT